MRHTENENPKGAQLLSELALFASDLNQISGLEDQQEELLTWFEAFLAGHYADNTALRNSIMVIYKRYYQLYDTLHQFTPAEINASLALTQKLKGHDVQK